MDITRTPQTSTQDGTAAKEGPAAAVPAPAPAPAAAPASVKLPREIGGAPGPEPTRYGDWQHKGRVTDF